MSDTAIWIYTRGGVGDLSVQCDTDGGGFGVEAGPPSGILRRRTGYRSHNGSIVATLPDHLNPQCLNLARKMAYLKFPQRPRPFARRSYSRYTPPRVTHTGSGLASVLAYMALNDPQAFEDLVLSARTLIPRLRRIRFRKAKVYQIERELVRFGHDTVERSSRRPYQGEMILLDFENAEDIPRTARVRGRC